MLNIVLIARVHMTMIHAASHFDPREKRCIVFFISMLACGSVPIVMVLHLAALPPELPCNLL